MDCKKDNMQIPPLPLIPMRKGRGSARALPHRFAQTEVEAFDDGWDASDQATAPLCTTVRTEKVRSAITRNDSPDLGFEYGLNPYRGCEHGCSYCYALPRTAIWGSRPVWISKPNSSPR